MTDTSLDTAYNRNQMQTLFVMLNGQACARVVAKSQPKRISWWRKLQQQVMRQQPAGVPHKDNSGPFGTAVGYASAQASPRTTSQATPQVNPQCAARSPASHSPAGWRAPSVTNGSENSDAQFFALLDQMSARHRAVTNRDHLIAALQNARAVKTKHR